MNDRPAPGKRLRRRDFLKGLAGAGVVALGGYALGEMTPWLDYAAQAEKDRSASVLESTGTADRQPLQALVHAATLAANGHNAQPWRFVLHEGEVEILLD